MIIFRVLRAFILLLGFCAFLWLIGLLIFVGEITTFSAAVTDADPAPADAIVVLTGGVDRVPTGVELLKEGKGKKLFISGVYPGLPLDKVLGSVEVDQSLRDCCIILGHAAGSTEENAEETQDWLAIENYHTLRLVTANYHMPRSLLLFHHMLPEAVIIPHPINPEKVKLDMWWMHGGTANVLINEYIKYLFARIGIWTGAL